MNRTHDFKLNMPDYSDVVDIDILNDNFRVIDDALMAGLCRKEYTGNNMGSSDPASRKYAWAPFYEIKNENEFDVVVTDRNISPDLPGASITIEAGATYRKYINGTYYMNFYVQDQHDVTFRWFCDAETRIKEIDPSGGGSVSSVNVTGASSSHIVTSGGPITSSGTIEIDLAEGYSIPQTNKQTAWDGKAADLKAEIDSSTYVLTLQLKDSSGNLIGNERTIDLPLETMVVDGEYDPQSKKIKLELKNGNYVEFSVADLVSGLQTELSSSNKLDPTYIAYDATHRAVSDTEKDTWNGKQNSISDLATIRSGAAAGATAVQPSEMNSALATKQNAIDADHKLSSSLVSFSETQNAALASGIDSTKVAQISTNQSNILYGINNTVKNICKVDVNTILSHNPGATASGNVVTKDNHVYFTISDGEITINSDGSNSQVILQLCNYDDFTLLDNTDYTLLGCSSGSNIKYDLRVSLAAASNVPQYTTPVTVSHATESDYNVSIVVRASQSLSNIKIKPMLCLKSIYDADPSYQPYGAPNYDLTRLQSEDRAALAEEIDAGAKNKVDIESITTTQSSFVFQSRSINSLPAGSYVFSYNSTQASAGDAQLNVKNGSTILANPTISAKSGTNIIEFTITSAANTLDLYSVRAGTYSNFMICTKAAFGVSQKFVPYRPNWDLVANTVTYTNNIKVQSTGSISNANLDNITTSEERVYNNPTNLPSGTSGYVICRTITVDGQSAYQEIRFISSQINTIYGQSYPVFERRKVSGTWRDWNILDTNGSYRLDNGSSNATSKTIDISNIPDGVFLVTTRCSISATNRVGVSVYTLWIISSNYASSMFKSISETTNAKISSFSIASDGTATITYDGSGYHTTSLTRISI